MSRPLEFIASYLAKLRNGKEVNYGAMTYGSIRGSEEAHYIGLYAEVAIAHYYDAKLDYNIYKRGDNGIDLIIKNLPICVKATTYWRRPFLRVEVEHFKPECIYFCTAVDIENRLVRLVGWAKSQTVLSANTRTFVNNGPLNYVLEDFDLIEFTKQPLDVSIKTRKGDA